MLISCFLQCTDGVCLITHIENSAYPTPEKTAYRTLEKTAYRSLKKLLTVHLQIHLTACSCTEVYLWFGRIYGDSSDIQPAVYHVRILS